MARRQPKGIDTTEVSRLGLELGEKFHEILKDLLGRMPMPDNLSQMERDVRTAMLKLGNLMLTNWLALQNPAYPPQTVSCRCGAQASYKEMREGVLWTVVGRVLYHRAYYLCATCHQGTFPLDERLGVRPGEISAELEDLTACTGAQLPFGHGGNLFTRLTLLDISPQTMDKATQAYGTEMAAVEADWVTTSQDAEALLRQEREEPPLDRLYGSLDATKVHTDERRDASDQGWRDLKIGAWFETSAQPPATPDGDWDIQAEQITYFCDIAEAESFGDLLWATGMQRGAPQAKDLVFLGDGAVWIWNLVSIHYPQATQIVDWFHAAEHLTPVAAQARGTPAERSEWLSQAREDLWQGRLDAVIASCAAQVRPGCADDPAQAAVTYFTNNRQRMDYPTYRARGYQIGSGSVESGCKQIGIARLKVPGAMWDTDGARNVAKARAALLSAEHWDMLTRRRVRRSHPK